MELPSILGKRIRSDDIQNQNHDSQGPARHRYHQSSVKGIQLDEKDANFTSHVLLTVWPIVGKYLSLSTTIAASKTCRTLRKAIIDDETGKVKAANFECHDSILSDVPARSLPLALNAIDFQSLRCLRLQFPFPKKNSSQSGSPSYGAFPAVFTQFASQLAYAQNLQELFLEADSILAEEHGPYIKHLIKNFGENLSKCSSLKKIRIDLTTKYSGTLMAHFLKALTKTASRKQNSLESFRFNDNAMGGRSSKFMALEADSFFKATLAMRNLHTLKIRIPFSSTLMKSLFRAANQLQVSNAEPLLPHLKIVTIFLYIERTNLENVPPVTSLLDILAGCEKIREMIVALPYNVWEDGGLDGIRSIVKKNTQLSKLSIEFQQYHDEYGRGLDLVESCVKANSLRMLKIEKLNYANGERLVTVLKSLQSSEISLCAEDLCPEMMSFLRDKDSDVEDEDEDEDEYEDEEDYCYDYETLCKWNPDRVHIGYLSVHKMKTKQL